MTTPEHKEFAKGIGFMATLGAVLTALEIKWDLTAIQNLVVTLSAMMAFIAFKSTLDYTKMNTIHKGILVIFTIAYFVGAWTASFSKFRVERTEHNAEQRELDYIDNWCFAILLVPLLVVAWSIMKDNKHNMFTKNILFKDVHQKVMANIALFFIFAVVYYYLMVVDPSSFTIPDYVELNTNKPMFYLYFSGIIHTTIGFGDFAGSTPGGMVAIIAHAMMVIYINFVSK